jgi:serine/threonine protein phosphatase PrpC
MHRRPDPHVPDERIAEVLGRTADSESACRALVADALESGGSDNITVVVVRAQG